jgi:hypothetical protein
MADLLGFPVTGKSRVGPSLTPMRGGVRNLVNTKSANLRARKTGSPVTVVVLDAGRTCLEVQLKSSLYAARRNLKK